MGVTSREALKFSVFIIIFFSLVIPLGFNWQTAAQTSTPNSTYFLMVGHIGAGTIFLSDSNGFTDTYPSLFHNQVNEDSHPNTYQYVLGAIVQVTAKASTPNYVFDHWLLDGKPYTTNSLTVTIDSNHTLMSCFKLESTTSTPIATPAPTGMPTPSTLPQDEWVLSVSQVGSGSVQIRKSDTGAPVGATGTFRYPDGQTVTIQTYKHHDGWRLDHWLLDGVPYTDWKINITMNSDHTVVAYFVPWNFTLSISCSNGGYTDPAGDQIYPVMAPDYPLTKKVTVTAYPYDNYRFDHWLWDGTTNTDNPITVSMDPVFDKNHTLQAIFILSTDAQGQFVGSKNGEVYHYPTCSYVASINAENKIWFVDAQDAVNQKYEPCSRCNPPRPNTNTPTPTTSPTTMTTIAPTPAPTPTPSPTTPTSTATPALTFMPDPTSTTVPLQTSTPAPAPTQDGIQPTSTPIKTATPIQTTLPPTSTPTQSPDPADSPQPPTASPESTEVAAPSDVPTSTVAPIQNQTTQNSNAPSPNLSPNPQAQEAPNITVIVVLAAMILIAILLTIFKGKNST